MGKLQRWRPNKGEELVGRFCLEGSKTTLSALMMVVIETRDGSR